jgi:hypothetical protein
MENTANTANIALDDLFVSSRKAARFLKCDKQTVVNNISHFPGAYQPWGNGSDWKIPLSNIAAVLESRGQALDMDLVCEFFPELKPEAEARG